MSRFCRMQRPAPRRIGGGDGPGPGPGPGPEPALPFSTSFPVVAEGLGPGWTYFGPESDFFCDADGAGATGPNPAVRDLEAVAGAWEIVLSVMPVDGASAEYGISYSMATFNGYGVVIFGNGFVRVNKVTGGVGALLDITGEAVYSAGQTLRIVPTATGLALSVDGTPVLTTEGTDYLSGTTIAVGISDTAARIRSIAVEAPEA